MATRISDTYSDGAFNGDYLMVGLLDTENRVEIAVKDFSVGQGMEACVRIPVSALLDALEAAGANLSRPKSPGAVLNDAGYGYGSDIIKTLSDAGFSVVRQDV